MAGNAEHPDERMRVIESTFATLGLGSQRDRAAYVQQSLPPSGTQLVIMTTLSNTSDPFRR